MNPLRKSRSGLLLPACALAFGAAIFGAPKMMTARTQTQSDNTKMNSGDANKDATTADQQKMSPGDRAITQKIRAEVMKDKSLSTYAHNVKIIAQDGKVTLKGPVRTKDEKLAVEEKATAIAGDGNVTSEITIVPPKS